MSTLKARFFFCKKEDAHVSFCFDIFSKVKILIFFFGDKQKILDKPFGGNNKRFFFVNCRHRNFFWRSKQKKSTSQCKKIFKEKGRTKIIKYRFFFIFSLNNKCMQKKKFARFFFKFLSHGNWNVSTQQKTLSFLYE